MKFLIESLKNDSFNDYQKELDNAQDKDKGALIKSQIEDEYDPDGLTKNFGAFLQMKIAKDGWESTDPFMIWLSQADDKNIEALNSDSAETLEEILNQHIKGETETLEDGKFKKEVIDFNNSDYILKPEFKLFDGSASDISYKLKALINILDPKMRDSFVEIDEKGNLKVWEKGTNNRLKLEPRTQKDAKGNPVLDKAGKEVTINVYVTDDGKEVPWENVEIDRPSLDDIMDGDAFKSASEMKKALSMYVREKVEEPGKDKSKSKSNSNKETGPTKPTLYSILLKWPGVKVPRDRNSKFNSYPQDFRQFLANCLSDYYKLVKKDKDYQVKAEKDFSKLGTLLNNPKNHADAFWNVMPNTSKNTSDLGSAIINQFFKDPTGKSKLK